MPFFIVNQDITKIEVDAIVNSTSPQPINIGGAEASLFDAGGSSLLKERVQVGTIPFGESRISLAYNLPSQFVIHTASPIYSVTDNFISLLQRSYLSAMELAVNNNLTSIAFPLLASGANGCKRELAIETAIETINSYISSIDIDVYLVLYKPYHPKRLTRMKLNLRSYLAHEENTEYSRFNIEKSFRMESVIATKLLDSEIEFQTFQEKLFQIIDNNDLFEPTVYKKANISRKLFSKIRSDRFYIPSKSTVIALVFALKLDLEEALDLLQSAGYYLADGIEYDRIIKFFIEKNIHNVLDINITLHEYGYKPLGSK